MRHTDCGAILCVDGETEDATNPKKSTLMEVYFVGYSFSIQHRGKMYSSNRGLKISSLV